MSLPRREKIRIFLANRMLTGFCGLTLSELSKLLRRHQYAIDPPYLPRAAVMITKALINSVINSREERVYNARLREVEVEPPLFILGHQRSGTSHLAVGSGRSLEEFEAIHKSNRSNNRNRRPRR